MKGLTLAPVTLTEACAFVTAHHRHCKRRGIHKYSVGAALGGKLVGVAIVARPVARALDDGETLEVARVCTDGTANACSFLYGAACRVAKALGYSSVTTYTLTSEPGTSLIAAGFTRESLSSGRSWDCGKRKRPDALPPSVKVRWRRELNQPTRGADRAAA